MGNCVIVILAIIDENVDWEWMLWKFLLFRLDVRFV